MNARRRVVVLAGVAVAAAATSLATSVAGPRDSRGGTPPGSQLFVAKGCAGCHTLDASASVGPSLAGASSWAGERIAGLSAEEYLVQSMLDPSSFISPAWERPGGPTDGMPRLRLSTDEVAALVEFLLQAEPQLSG